MRRRNGFCRSPKSFESWGMGSFFMDLLKGMILRERLMALGMRLGNILGRRQCGRRICLDMAFFDI